MAADSDFAEKIFPELFRTYIAPARLGGTLERLVAAVNDPSQRVQNLVPILQSNPLYPRLITQLDTLKARVKQWDAEETNNPRKDAIVLERTLNLVGSATTRNLALTIRLSRISGQGLPKKKSDKLMLAPQDTLKRAIAAEEFCQTNRIPYAEEAFVAGYHFDLLEAILKSRKASKEALAQLDLAWEEGFTSARIASGIAGRLKDFKFGRYAFGGALLAEIGRPLMSLAFPKDLGEKSWAALIANTDKMKSFGRLAFDLMERQQFPISYCELSALFVSTFSYFRVMERAIFHLREPYYLKAVNRDLYILSSILAISGALAPDPTSPSALDLARIDRLPDLKIDLPSLTIIARGALVKK